MSVDKDTGQADVYVMPFSGSALLEPMPEKKAPIKISEGGGLSPVWSRKGNELFYRNGDEVRSVTYETESGEFEILEHKPLFNNPLLPGDYRYDVSSNGDFFMIKESEDHPHQELILVQNWFEYLNGLF